MKNKLAAFATAALFSLNASAGYVQYNLSSPGISGYFVQNEADHSIAYFDLAITATDGGYRSIAPWGGYADIAWAIARYDNRGPTRFGIDDVTDEGIAQHISFNFSSTTNPNVYTFISYYLFEQIWSPFEWYVIPPETHYPSGTATRGEVDPFLVNALNTYLRETNGERYDAGVHRIVPQLNVIPEPTSLALFALGAAGLACLRRRTAKP